MLQDVPDPNPLEAKKLIESLCQHLSALEKDAPDDMRAELRSYRATLEQCSQGVVDEFNQAKTEYQAAQANAQAQATQSPSPTPLPATEEDVLSLGVALRAQLLDRYRVPPPPVDEPIESSDVTGMSTGDFATGETPKLDENLSKTPPVRPAPKPGDDAWDLSSGEWNK